MLQDRRLQRIQERKIKFITELKETKRMAREEKLRFGQIKYWKLD